MLLLLCARFNPFDLKIEVKPLKGTHYEQQKHTKSVHVPPHSPNP